MSELPVDRNRYSGRKPRCHKLLALQDVWRGLECVAPPDRATPFAQVAMMPGRLVRDLVEVIAAIDRRSPQANNPGEAAIVRDAAALNARALTRLAELERELVSCLR